MRSVSNSFGLTKAKIASVPVSVGLLRISTLASNPPKGGNHVVDTDAEVTPGTSSIVRRMASFAFNRACQFVFVPFGSAALRAKTWSGSKPSGICVRARKAFVAAPAPAMRRSVRETCPAIRSRCVLRLRALPECLVLFAWMSSLMGGRESCQAGEMPKRIPVITDRAALKARTVPLTRIAAS